MLSRLPFFYGWVIVGVAFVTMGVGVNARTAFSLLFPPILDEFRLGARGDGRRFFLGFLVSAVLSPSLGRLMDRRGPRVVMELGVLLVASGLMLATLVREPWHLYMTLAPAFQVAILCCVVSAVAIWLAAPRHVRAVAGRVHRPESAAG